MEQRDRALNLATLALAGVAWVLVALLVTSRDPLVDPSAGPIGTVLIGVACGLTAAPLMWLTAFARHGRIAYRGSWVRAFRRGAWVAVVVALFVGLRLQGAFSVPLALFVIVIVVVAEATLSVER